MQPASSLKCIQFGFPQDYSVIYNRMRELTLQRDAHTSDEIWLLEHNPVFTQGQAGKPEHILQTSESIPIIQSDRGGQVTYHGPGQIMIYALCDLNRRNLCVRGFSNLLENAIITLLKEYNIIGYIDTHAPGIYVNSAKIASIGLRVRKGFSYHGMALNVNGDLSPFSMIHPCGYQNLKMTNMSDFVPNIHISTIYQKLSQILPTLL